MRLGIGVWVLLAGACVPKGHHELVEVQLEATRTAMLAEEARCRTELAEGGEKLSACDAEIGARQAQLDALSDEVADLRAELAAAAEAHALRASETGAIAPEDRDALAAALVRDAQARMAQEHRDHRHAAVVALFAPWVERGAAIRQTPDGSVVALPVSQLFNEGRTSLSPLGESLVAAAAGALAKLPDHRVEVRGHTDAKPFHTAEIASSWELGFAWAVSVLRALQDQSPPQAITASSWADTAPFDGDPGDPARRRVELVLTLDPDVAGRFAPTPPPEPAPADP